MPLFHRVLSVFYGLVAAVLRFVLGAVFPRRGEHPDQDQDQDPYLVVLLEVAVGAVHLVVGALGHLFGVGLVPVLFQFLGGT